MAGHVLGLRTGVEGFLMTHQISMDFRVSYDIAANGAFVVFFTLDDFGVEPLTGPRPQKMQPCFVREGTPDSSFRCVSRIKLKLAYRCPAEGQTLSSPVVYGPKLFDTPDTACRLYTETVILEHLFHFALMDFDVFRCKSEAFILAEVKTALSNLHI